MCQLSFSENNSQNVDTESFASENHATVNSDRDRPTTAGSGPASDFRNISASNIIVPNH